MHIVLYATYQTHFTCITRMRDNKIWTLAVQIIWMKRGILSASEQICTGLAFDASDESVFFLVVLYLCWIVYETKCIGDEHSEKKHRKRN